MAVEPCSSGWAGLWEVGGWRSRVGRKIVSQPPTFNLSPQALHAGPDGRVSWERTWNNVRTGERVPIQEHRVPVFSPKPRASTQRHGGGRGARRMLLTDEPVDATRSPRAAHVSAAVRNDPSMLPLTPATPEREECPMQPAPGPEHHLCRATAKDEAIDLRAVGPTTTRHAFCLFDHPSRARDTKGACRCRA